MRPSRINLLFRVTRPTVFFAPTVNFFWPECTRDRILGFDHWRTFPPRAWLSHHARSSGHDWQSCPLPWATRMRTHSMHTYMYMYMYSECTAYSACTRTLYMYMYMYMTDTYIYRRLPECMACTFGMLGMHCPKCWHSDSASWHAFPSFPRTMSNFGFSFFHCWSRCSIASLAAIN